MILFLVKKERRFILHFDCDSWQVSPQTKLLIESLSLQMPFYFALHCMMESTISLFQ